MNKLFSFFLILLTVINISTPIVDPDIWWHIVIGRWVLHHGFPYVDHWNMYSQGDFRAYSWLPEIFYAVIDKHLGVVGLLYLKVFIGIALGLSLYYVFMKLAKDEFISTVLSMITLAGFVHNFTLRPQMISWLCFIWCIYFANKVYKDGWSKKTYIQVFLIFSLWTNSHLTQALGMLVFFMWGFNGFNKNTYKLFLVPFLGTLLNPYFLNVWITFLTKTNHPFLFKEIVEFQPATILSYSSGILGILFFFNLLFLHFYDKTISKMRLLLIVMFLFAGLTIVKFLPYAIILLSTTGCILWEVDFGKKVFHFHEAIEKFKGFLSNFYGVGGAFFLICLIIVNFNSLIKAQNNNTGKIKFPISAINFIKEHKLQFPILNSFDMGGYLIYSFSNEKGEPLTKVPIDGRTNVNSLKVYKMAGKSAYGMKGWKKYIKYVNPNTILWSNSSPFVRLLAMDKENWCRVFNEKGNDGFSVFVKSQGKNKNLCLNLG